MKKFTGLTVLCLLALVSFSASAIELHITTGFTPPVSDYFKKILQEADKRMPDVTISFEVLPAERSLDLANKGVNDAECCRIPPVVKAGYPNLHEVPVSFFTTRFSAFAKTKDLPVKTFEDLKPYAVAVPKGWKLVVNRVNEVKPKELFEVTTPLQLFKMIDNDHAEVGVVGYLSGLHAIKELGLHGIYALNPPLVEKQLYLMLHEKHKDLMPAFSEVFEQMTKDGTVEKIYNEFVIQ